MTRTHVRPAILLSLLVAGVAHAETPIPSPPDHWVTDHAGFLSAAAASELDGRLGDYDRRTGHQVVVYIDRTTGGAPIEDWAVKAFQGWKVGRKGLDDGVALFVFSEDRKLRIEVGYGLEDHVTDALASRIISERIVPRIRAGDNDGAVRAGVDALIAAIGAPPGADPVAEPAPHISGWHLALGAIVILLLLGFAITHPGLAWLMLLSIGSGRGGGGGFGGGGGGGGFSGGGGRSGGGGASGSW